MKPKTEEQKNRARLSAINASQERSDDRELDLRLDLALGRPEDLSQYQDCIRAARRKRAET